MSTLQRPTVELHYEDTGRGRDLVFLHGWCDGSASWASTIAAFSADYRCLAPDMRGHGRSGVPRDHAFTVEALTNDIVALCEAAGVSAPVLIGHSYGGYLAAETARRFPGFARAIVVEDQALDLSGFAVQMRALESVIRSPDSHMAFRGQMLGSMMSPLMPSEDRAMLEALQEATPVGVALGLWAALFEFSEDEIAQRSADLIAALGKQPSLTIEHAPSPEYHALVARLAPSAQAQVLGAGHWIHLEQPAEFRSLIRTFLATI